MAGNGAAEIFEDEGFKARFRKARGRFSPDERLPPAVMSESHVSPPADMSGLHSKLGFRVEELKPKEGRETIKGSSIPLILPNDLKYNVSNGVVEKVEGVRRGSLQIVPEALGLLETIEEPVSVLAICGPCRSGKSYILSRLLGSTDAFELGHSTDPQTFGIWMGTKVLRGKDFTIVLLDTEGIDAVGASAGQDASILVMTILLSSYLIYNSLNVAHKTDLEKMQCFITLAKGITVKQGKRASQAQFREFFPDFLWLLRDVSLKMLDKDGKDMDPTEYLVTKVLRRDPDDFEESTSDKVGRAILTFFSSVECATLQRPSVEPEIMNNIAQLTDKLNPEFNKGVTELIERLLLKSRAKRGYHRGSNVIGEALSIMITKYVEAVNDPNSIPALDNTWKHTVEAMQKKVIDELVVEYNQEMQAKIAEASGNGKVPLEEVAEDGKNQSVQPTLMNFHNELFKVLTDKLLTKVGHFGASSEKQGTDERHDVVGQMQKRLVRREEHTVDYVAADGTTYHQKGSEVTGGELLHYIKENRKLSKIFCQHLYRDLFDPIRKRAQNPPPDYEFEQLVGELTEARQRYDEQARGPEKWTVLQELTKNQDLEASFKMIKGYQDKLMKERQKAEELELAAMERARELRDALRQTQAMHQAQQETLQKMEQQHKEQMEKLQEQENERREREDQKYRDMQKAHMKEIAAVIKEHNERESSKVAEALLALQDMQKENAELNRKLVQVIESQKAPPPPPAPPAKKRGWCTTS